MIVSTSSIMSPIVKQNTAAVAAGFTTANFPPNKSKCITSESTIGYVDEFTTMHYFGNPGRTQSMVAYRYPGAKILYLRFHNCRGRSIENFEKAQKANSSSQPNNWCIVGKPKALFNYPESLVVIGQWKADMTTWLSRKVKSWMPFFPPDLVDIIDCQT